MRWPILSPEMSWSPSASDHWRSARFWRREAAFRCRASPGIAKQCRPDRQVTMFTLIENGELYGPESLGRASLLIVQERIARIGPVPQAWDALGLPVQIIDATDCIVTPGFIDPHEHLLGGSGESGWNSQTPEIAFQEIVSAGITTVVGCLGVDTTT